MQRPPNRGRLVTGFLLCLLISPTSWAAQDKRELTLAEQIEKVLARTSAQRAFWGIEIVELATGSVLYQRNADKLFVPASNQKLFSTALALSRLGPDYRHATSVLTSSAVNEAGVLTGDIILLGGGDPNLSSRVVPYDPKRNFHPNLLRPISELASQVAGGGVQRIEGSVIGDDTRYVRQPHGTGWSADDPKWGYGAPISALSFNDNVITMRVLPGRQPGRPARLTLEPRIPYFEFENKTRTAPTRTVARSLRADREPGTRTVLLWGQISIRSRGRSIAIAVDDPALYAALALKEELERQGIEVTGETGSRHRWPHEMASLKRGRPQEPSPEATTLAAIQSASLADYMPVINKTSQNLHAEMLLREVGYVGLGVGSFEAGLAELKAFLLQADLKAWEFKTKDASGLSRHNLVTPAGTVKLLTHMWASPHRDLYRQSLAVAGDDGTLDWRFSRTKARGRIQAKTGTLSNVAALSGYALTVDERDLAFSIYVNNIGGPISYVRRLVDQICLAMVKARPETTQAAKRGASQEADVR